MRIRRFLLVLLSPIWLLVVALAFVVGMTAVSGASLPQAVLAGLDFPSVEARQLAELFIRLLLVPFKLVFTVMVIGALVWFLRRRNRFSAWVMGEPLAERMQAEGMPGVFKPERRRTLQQMLSSGLALTALALAVFLILGQFIARDDLAIVLAALTSSLAWGARLPIGDFLGGISNIFDNDLAVGDQIEFRQAEHAVSGIVESVDVRFLSVRAQSGELTTIPFGDLRIFRNYTRGEHVGVYAVFSVAAADLGRAYSLLSDLAPVSTDLVSPLVKPFQTISRYGEMGVVTDICVFGQTHPGAENELQLGLHTLVHERFAAAGIPLGAPEDAES